MYWRAEAVAAARLLEQRQRLVMEVPFA